MIVNFFKTILREFKSNKTYTAIKVLGLAFGIACAIVIISFVINMMSFNNMHEKGDRIYQAFHRSMYKNTGENISGTVSAKLAPALKQEIPEIRNSVTVNDISDVLFIVNENRIKESGVYSDESLFSIFTFPVISQMSDSIFNGPNSIAISESLAKKLFGNIDNVLGHSVLIRQSNSKKELTVSSIFRDIPDNSTIRFEFVLPIREYLKEHSRSNHWGNMFANAYVELNEKADINTLNKKLQNFIKEHKENSERELFLFPFTKVFLEHPQGAVKSITIIEVMLIIGLGILIIACINYINIAVSQSSKKAREVGLRKAIGSNRKSLIFRFLGESFVITVISIIFAVGIAEILFSILSESIREISVMYIPYNNSEFFLIMILLTLVLSLVSGFYPAIYLSSFTPIKVLKGEINSGSKTFGFRKALILIQFFASTFFIVGTIIIHKQMTYIKNKDLGLDINYVVSFELEKGIREHLDVFKSDLNTIPGIKNFTFSSFQPIGVYSSTSDPKWEGKTEETNDMFSILEVDENFIETFNIEILKGKSFSDAFVDEGNYLINGRMAQIMAKDNPVGEGLSFWGSSGKIVGVVNDFNFDNLAIEINPLIIILSPESTSKGFIKVEPGNVPEVLAALESVYAKYEKEYPFEYSFLDEDFVKNHMRFLIMEDLAKIFSSISIIISCMGLFGLTALTITQKTKEIGIRKILGSSVTGIVSLLSKQMIILVAVAYIIATPIGFYVMKKWLQNFAYSVEIGIEVFILSFMLVVVIALLTIISLAFRAAKANPVVSLRYE